MIDCILEYVEDTRIDSFEIGRENENENEHGKHVMKMRMNMRNELHEFRVRHRGSGPWQGV